MAGRLKNKTEQSRQKVLACHLFRLGFCSETLILIMLSIKEQRKVDKLGNNINFMKICNGFTLLSRLRRPCSSDSMSLSGLTNRSWYLLEERPLMEVVMDELKERIIELEIRYTHQNSVVEELNTELTLANARIDRLERQVMGMHEMLGSLGPELTQSPDE